MNLEVCPKCFSKGTIRGIFWGIPESEPDPNVYMLGGCCPEEGMPDKGCVSCDWRGSNLEVETSARLQRFVWTDEDTPGIVFDKKLRINKKVLSDLEVSKSWRSETWFSAQFTPESVYGPEGKLKWLWNKTWISQEEMQLDLYSNMGGGVPKVIIEELMGLVTESPDDE